MLYPGLWKFTGGGGHRGASAALDRWGAPEDERCMLRETAFSYAFPDAAWEQIL
jgi:hypothetical protein